MWLRWLRSCVFSEDDSPFELRYSGFQSESYDLWESNEWMSERADKADKMITAIAAKEEGGRTKVPERTSARKSVPNEMNVKLAKSRQARQAEDESKHSFLNILKKFRQNQIQKFSNLRNLIGVNRIETKTIRVRSMRWFEPNKVRTANDHCGCGYGCGWVGVRVFVTLSTFNRGSIDGGKAEDVAMYGENDEWISRWQV